MSVPERKKAIRRSVRIVNVPEVTEACVNDAVSAALNRYFVAQTWGDTELQLTVECRFDDLMVTVRLPDRTASAPTA